MRTTHWTDRHPAWLDHVRTRLRSCVANAIGWLRLPSELRQLRHALHAQHDLLREILQAQTGRTIPRHPLPTVIARDSPPITPRTAADVSTPRSREQERQRQALADLRAKLQIPPSPPPRPGG